MMMMMENNHQKVIPHTSSAARRSVAGADAAAREHTGRALRLTQLVAARFARSLSRETRHEHTNAHIIIIGSSIASVWCVVCAY